MQVLTLLNDHDGEENHELDFPHLVPLDPCKFGVKRIKCGDEHPTDEHQQQNGLTRPDHFLFLFREQKGRDGDDGGDEGKREIIGEAPSLPVRVHVTQPAPQQNTDPWALENEGQHAEDNRGNQYVSHVFRSIAVSGLNQFTRRGKAIPASMPVARRSASFRSWRRPRSLT